MFSKLSERVDIFIAKHSDPGPEAERMKSDLLELVDEAIAHGEQKDQGKISGIIVNGIKALFGKKE